MNSTRFGPALLPFLYLALAIAGPATADVPAQFTPLSATKPRIVASSVAYPGGRYEATNLMDGNVRTEYSSASKGQETFIDFDFGQPVPIAGLHHLDRADPATVARSRLTFSDAPDFQNTLAVVEVQHANTRSGTTTVAFAAVRARYVRWQVLELGPQRYATVGGAEIAFFHGLRSGITTFATGHPGARRGRLAAR